MESANLETLATFPISSPQLYGFQAQPFGSDSWWRRRQASLSLNTGSIEAGSAARWQVSSCRCAHFELHQLGRDTHVRADAIQLGVAEQTHRHDLSFLKLCRWVCRDSRRRADPRKQPLVPGYR